MMNRHFDFAELANLIPSSSNGSSSSLSHLYSRAMIRNSVETGDMKELVYSFAHSPVPLLELLSSFSRNYVSE